MTAERIFAWVTEVEERASKKGFVFTDHTELFTYGTSELGMLPVVSSSHLSKPNIFG